MTADPHRVVVLSHDDYNTAEYSAPDLLIDPQTLVVAVPLRRPGAVSAVVAAAVTRTPPGTLLMRGPRKESKLVAAAEAYEQMSVEKFVAFAEVCQLLGARRLELEELSENRGDLGVSASVKFNGKVARVDGDGEYQAVQRVAQRISGVWKWKPRRADSAAARRRAQDLGIDGDTVVRGLIEQRALSRSLQEHRLVLDISADAQREIRAAADMATALGRLGPKFSASGEFLKKQSDRLSLALTVQF
jgi:hypothetical protein